MMEEIRDAIDGGYYKEYKIYPKKDINPQIIEVVDNSYLEKYLYLANEEG